jgi:hypothetical protein
MYFSDNETMILGSAGLSLLSVKTTAGTTSVNALCSSEEPQIVRAAFWQ